MSSETARADTASELSHLSRRYRPALMSFFLRRLRNRAEAEDLTQEVFVRLAASDPTSMKSAAAYIFQVAANLLRDRSRREKVRADYAAGIRLEEGVGVELRDPARILVGRRSLAALAARLRELPERTRVMFVLYHVEHMDKRAIAEMYNVSVSTVEKNIGKAMAHLMLCRGDDE